MDISVNLATLPDERQLYHYALIERPAYGISP